MVGANAVPHHTNADQAPTATICLPEGTRISFFDIHALIGPQPS
jgi:hypothetical protein